jgi:hypothetical protein
MISDDTRLKLGVAENYSDVPSDIYSIFYLEIWRL